MRKYLREHLNPEPSMNEEGGRGGVGKKKKKSWKMDSLTSKDNK